MHREGVYPVILNPLERRRAETFARQLEFDDPDHLHSTSVAQASGASEAELAELLGVTERLEDLGEQLVMASAPSSEWRDATRRRLMAVAADEGIGATARHRASVRVPKSSRAPVHDDMFPQRPRGGRRLAAVATLLTATVAISGVAAASDSALPGETLYNVKRSAERAQLALAGDELSRGQLYLEFARTRIHEAKAVADDDEAVLRALDDAHGDVMSGVSLLGELAAASDDPTPLDAVDLFTNEHRRVLDDLVAELDGAPEAAAVDLRALLEDAALRSVELREALFCTEAGGASDALGPLPGVCGALQQRGNATESSGPGATSSGSSDGPQPTGGGMDEEAAHPEPDTPSQDASASPSPADERPSGSGGQTSPAPTGAALLSTTMPRFSEGKSA
jgi:hypothetical protein